jgi:hypothetical protein
LIIFISRKFLEKKLIQTCVEYLENNSTFLPFHRSAAYNAHQGRSVTFFWVLHFGVV